MASLEDVDDVEAGRALEKEAADEQLEFDDNGGVSNRVRGDGVVAGVAGVRATYSVGVVVVVLVRVRVLVLVLVLVLVIAAAAAAAAVLGVHFRGCCACF